MSRRRRGIQASFGEDALCEVLFESACSAEACGIGLVFALAIQSYREDTAMESLVRSVPSSHVFKGDR